MYAVIKTGGKQYRVSPGDMLKVESIDTAVGSTINFEEVLMIANGEELTVGSPTIASAKVAALVVAHGRAKKVEIIKFRRRKHHQKRTGHRQNFTQVQIQNINGEGAPERVATPKTDDAVKAEKDSKKEVSAEKSAPKKDTTAEAKSVAKATDTDDLTKIEGIGPKAANALVEGGITSYSVLAETSIEAIKKILDEADGHFASMKPDTWPKQSALAADGKWDELKELQDRIDGGVEKS